MFELARLIDFAETLRTLLDGLEIVRTTRIQQLAEHLHARHRRLHRRRRPSHRRPLDDAAALDSPVTTVPRPEIENTSSTGIRNGLSPRCGSGLAVQCPPASESPARRFRFITSAFADPMIACRPGSCTSTAARGSPSRRAPAACVVDYVRLAQHHGAARPPGAPAECAARLRYWTVRRRTLPRIAPSISALAQDHAMGSATRAVCARSDASACITRRVERMPRLPAPRRSGRTP